MSYSGYQHQGAFHGPRLPGVESIFQSISCQYCSNTFHDVETRNAHQAICWMRGSAQIQHGLMARYPPSPSSSGVSDSDSTAPMYTPVSSRESSVSSSQRSSVSTKAKATRRNTRRSPATVTADHHRKAKKTEKEKHNRGLQAAVVARHEDTLAEYCAWERIEQSGGNGNSAGLTSCKINVMRAYERVGAFFLHKARCDAIRSGNLANFELEMKELIEACLTHDFQPGSGTFLELPPGELYCDHEDTKSKSCSVHGHPDWIECRKSRKAAIFRRNEDRFIANLGMTREQAMYGAHGASAPTQTHPTLPLPHRFSRH